MTATTSTPSNDYCEGVIGKLRKGISAGQLSLMVTARLSLSVCLGEKQRPSSSRTEDRFILSEKDAAGIFTINRKAHECAFDNRSKIVGGLMLRLVVLRNQFQSLPELEHGSELVLTGVTAKTVAGQIPDLPIHTLKFQLIDLGAFHDRSTLGAIEADVPHTALHVVVMTAFSNIMADFHGREVIQLKAGIIIAGYIDIFLFIRSLEPGDDLGIGQRCGIEGDEMRSGEEELTIDLRISDADHTLVIGQLDFEVVSDINHTATQPFELPLMLPMDKSRGFSVH